MAGRSRLKAIVADQMETLLLTNANTHFWSRCVKTCVMRNKSEAKKSVNAAFLRRRQVEELEIQAILSQEDH